MCLEFAEKPESASHFRNPGKTVRVLWLRLTISTALLLGILMFRELQIRAKAACVVGIFSGVILLS